MNNTSEGLTIDLDIEEAMQLGNLTVHYQPIFDIKTFNPILVEAEALVRWDHPKLGFLSPTEFEIWHASDSITTALTDYVLQLVVEQQVAWKKQNITLPVAVNLSISLIGDNKFPKRLAALLDQHDVDHALLVLELAEHESTVLSVSSMQTVERLMQNGFHVILDNFDWDSANLSELRRRSFTGLKIDAGQISDLTNNEGNRQIARGVIDLAHDLSLTAYAKKVETPQCLDILKSLGCDKAQGWYFGKPMPSRELTRLLVNQISVADQLETAVPES